MKRPTDIWRGSPVRDLYGVTNRLNRWFEDWIEPPIFEEDRWSGLSESDLNEGCQETETHYLICTDLPGVPRENLEVQLFQNRIRIIGQRQWQGRERQESNYRTRIERTFILPEDADPDGIEASFRNGVLELAIPKKEESSQYKKIEVKEPEKAA